MINKIILILIFIPILNSSFGQNRKFVFLEGGGSGVLVNANFDIRLNKDNPKGLGLKAGFGHTFYLEDATIITFPIGINYLIGKKRNYLLLGANTTFAFFGKEDSRYNTTSFVPSLEIGYRFVPLKSGFSFQTTYNPLFNTVDGFMPIYIGIGIGYSWK